MHSQIKHFSRKWLSMGHNFLCPSTLLVEYYTTKKILLKSVIHNSRTPLVSTKKIYTTYFSNTNNPWEKFVILFILVLHPYDIVSYLLCIFLNTSGIQKFQYCVNGRIWPVGKLVQREGETVDGFYKGQDYSRKAKLAVNPGTAYVADAIA